MFPFPSPCSYFCPQIIAERTLLDAKESKKEEANARPSVSLYGRASVDLRPLLKPGSTSVSGCSLPHTSARLICDIGQIFVKTSEPPLEVVQREAAEREAAEAKAKKTAAAGPPPKKGKKAEGCFRALSVC